MITIESQNAREFGVIGNVFKSIEHYKCSDYLKGPTPDELALYNAVNLKSIFKEKKLELLDDFNLSLVEIFDNKFTFTDNYRKISFTIKKKTLTKEEKDLEKIDEDLISKMEKK